MHKVNRPLIIREFIRGKENKKNQSMATLHNCFKISLHFNPAGYVKEGEKISPVHFIILNIRRIPL